MKGSRDEGVRVQPVELTREIDGWIKERKDTTVRVKRFPARAENLTHLPWPICNRNR